MKKVIVVILAALGLALLAGTANGTENDKVTICHRTNSNTNPYVQITVDEHAVDGLKGADHFGRHQGPVWNPGLKDSHVKWGDIIPPVSPYHNGLNWNSEGRAIYDNGCNPVETPDTPVTTIPEYPDKPDTPDRPSFTPDFPGTPDSELIPPLVIERATPEVANPAFTG